MLCPYCQTENRVDRETCYYCGKDISTIRLVTNKARQHYNDALEHAERGRTIEAIDELKNAIDLDRSLVNAHVVLGTLYARQEKFDEARECWKNALELNPELDRAHEYLSRLDTVEVALPTLSLYRRTALALLIATVALAAVLIFRSRPPQGQGALQQANVLMEQRRYGDAKERLAQARALAEPGSVVDAGSRALASALQLNLDSQVSMIQYLKYQQLYPEALHAIAELESIVPDDATSAALATIRADINYYYYNLISQLYTSYAQGDLDFETFHHEISQYLELYPELPEQNDIRGYLDRAERMEAQAEIDELRRRFSFDNNAVLAIEGLEELDARLGQMPGFKSERLEFIEEILSYQFNMFTGYLDQEEFLSAASLLSEIERVTTEFRDVVEVDISGAVDLAWSVLRDARRQSDIATIEKLINDNEFAAAEEAIWSFIQEPDMSDIERVVIRSYWRKIRRMERLERLLNHIGDDDSSYFELEISDRLASRTLRLYDDLESANLKRSDQVYLTGLAAAAAKRLGMDDHVTSLTARLESLDENSTVTEAVKRMAEEEPDPSNETTPANEPGDDPDDVDQSQNTDEDQS